MWGLIRPRKDFGRGVTLSNLRCDSIALVGPRLFLAFL